MNGPRVDDLGVVDLASVENLSRADLREWVRRRLQGEDSVGPADPRWGEMPHHLLAVLYPELSRPAREDLQGILLSFLEELRHDPKGDWAGSAGAELLLLLDPILVESSRKPDAVDLLLTLAELVEPSWGDKPGLHFRVLQGLLVLRHRAGEEFWRGQAARGGDRYAGVVLDGLSLVDIAATFRWLNDRPWSESIEAAFFRLLPGLLEDYGAAKVIRHLEPLLRVIPPDRRAALVRACGQEGLALDLPASGRRGTARQAHLPARAIVLPEPALRTPVKGSVRRSLRLAKEALLRAGMFSSHDRRSKERALRKLHITRLSAAAEMRGLRYSRFIHGLRLARIGLSRQLLTELAIHDPETFDAITSRLRQALDAADKARSKQRRAFGA